MLIKKSGGYQAIGIKEYRTGNTASLCNVIFNFVEKLKCVVPV